MAPLSRWVALRPRSRISPGRSGDTAGIPRAPVAIGHRGFVLLSLLLSLGCLYPQPRVWPALEAAAPLNLSCLSPSGSSSLCPALLPSLPQHSSGGPPVLLKSPVIRLFSSRDVPVSVLQPEPWLFRQQGEQWAGVFSSPIVWVEFPCEGLDKVPKEHQGECPRWVALRLPLGGCIYSLAACAHRGSCRVLGGPGGLGTSGLSFVRMLWDMAAL